MANPRGQQRDKPFRDALRMEIAEAGENHKRLRGIARKMLELAEAGDMQAIKEIGDRLDGKPAQAIVGDDEHDPIKIETIRRIIVRPGHSDGGSVPAAPEPGSV